MSLTIARNTVHATFAVKQYIKYKSAGSEFNGLAPFPLVNGILIPGLMFPCYKFWMPLLILSYSIMDVIKLYLIDLNKCIFPSLSILE